MGSCEYNYQAGLSQLVKPGKKALPRAYKCRGFPSILWAQTSPLQLNDGHISKHCFMEGLGCGNKSTGERECIQTQEQKKVGTECSWGGNEICVGDGVCVWTHRRHTYAYIRFAYCKLHWHIAQFENNNKKGSDFYGYFYWCLLSLYPHSTYISECNSSMNTAWYFLLH